MDLTLPAEFSRTALAMAVPDYPFADIELLQHPGIGALYLRPVHPQDRERERSFLQALSKGSLRNRTLGGSINPSEQTLDRLVSPDYVTSYVLAVQEFFSGRFLAVGRLGSRTDNAGGPLQMEFALVVADHVQGKGLGNLIMPRLIRVARRLGAGELVADTLAGNQSMLALARRHAMLIEPSAEDGQLRTLRLALN